MVPFCPLEAHFIQEGMKKLSISSDTFPLKITLQFPVINIKDHSFSQVSMWFLGFHADSDLT